MGQPIKLGFLTPTSPALTGNSGLDGKQTRHYSCHRTAAAAPPPVIKERTTRSSLHGRASTVCAATLIRTCKWKWILDVNEEEVRTLLLSIDPLGRRKLLAAWQAEAEAAMAKLPRLNGQ